MWPAQILLWKLFTNTRQEIKSVSARGNGDRREDVTGSPGLADPQVESDLPHAVDRDLGTLRESKYITWWIHLAAKFFFCHLHQGYTHDVLTCVETGRSQDSLRLKLERGEGRSAGELSQWWWEGWLFESSNQGVEVGWGHKLSATVHWELGKWTVYNKTAKMKD